MGRRRAARRQAVGLGADLGRDRPLRRQGALRQRGRVAEPAVPPRQGRGVVRPVRPREDRARQRRRGGAATRRSSPRRRSSASRPAPSTASRRSRTRRSSRSRRPSSTTSSGSRTATAARGRRRRSGRPRLPCLAARILDTPVLRSAAWTRRPSAKRLLRTGWSARMLRYLERTGLVVPRRSASGYRLYGLRELNQLRSLAELRRRFHVEIARPRVRGAAPARAGSQGRGRHLVRRQHATRWNGNSESTSGCSPPDREGTRWQRRSGTT